MATIAENKKKAKGKKSKGKTLNLNEFLADDKGSGSGGPGASYVLASKQVNWGDEMEEQDAEVGDSFENYGKPAVDRISLPTAPRAALGPKVALERVPTQPPFTAYLGNLPYDVDEEDIARFFKDLKILNVRLPSDMGRLKGFGYAEFEDRASLLEALSQDDAKMKNRNIKVDLASHNDGERGGGFGNRDNDREDRTQGDWRRTEDRPVLEGRPDDRGGSRYGDRGGERGDFFGADRGGDRHSERGGESFGGRGGDRYGDRGFGGDRGGDRYGGEHGGNRFGDRGGDRYGDRGGDRYGDRGGDRYGDRGGDRYDDRVDARYGSQSDRDGDRGRDRRGYDRFDERRGGSYDERGGSRRDGGGYRDSRDSDRLGSRDGDRFGDRRGGYESADRDPPRGAPAERPRLKLQPRSKPVESTESQTRSSIFGAAKPVDTTAREREIEARLQHEKEEEMRREDVERDNRRSLGSVGSSPDDRRPRRESERSTDETRRERKLSSSSSGKGARTVAPPPGSGSARVRRDSHLTDEEVFDEKSQRQTPVKPNKEETSPPAKIVPAPLPKENIWEKRKTQAPATSPPQELSKPRRESQEPERPAEQSSPPVSEKESAPAPVRSPPEKVIPAEPPKVNVWAQRKQEREEASKQRQDSVSSSTCSPSKTDQNATDDEKLEAVPVGRGQRPIRDREARGSESGESKRGDSNERGRGRGAGGAARGGRGRGERPQMGRGRGDKPGPKKEPREKPLPKSVEEMPKYEEKKEKDWSDANKFSTLMAEEEDQ